MNLVESYAEGVRQLTRYAPRASRPLVVDIIVNPAAGFFRRKPTVRARVQRLESTLGQLSRGPRPQRECTTRVHYTAHPGHAAELTAAILADSGDLEHWIIAAGGDGTANEISSCLVTAVELPPGLRLFRFPLGTGNDAADAATIDAAHGLLLRAQGVRFQGALEVRGADGTLRFAFNVASFGLDAYVAHITTHAKRLMPGDAYRACVDLASLVYPAAVRQLPAQVADAVSGRTLWEGVPTLLAFGVSGHRTYGGGMRILPGPQNACLIRSMSLGRKITTKAAFYRGDHGHLPEVTLISLDAAVIKSPVGLPMQLDGEVTWLEADDFPLRVQVRPHCLPLLAGLDLELEREER